MCFQASMILTIPFSIDSIAKFSLVKLLIVSIFLISFEKLLSPDATVAGIVK